MFQGLRFCSELNPFGDFFCILCVVDLRWKLIISAAPLSGRVYQLSVAAAALELR